MIEQQIIKNGLKRLFSDGPVRMHMPGHKGKKSPYFYDVTEVPGADDLYNPKGIIKRAEEKLATLRGARDALFLVGGATSGLQASLLSVLGEGDKILIPTNAHYSVYAALATTRAEPVYFSPEPYGPGSRVTLKIIEEEIKKNPDLSAVLLVSPDYYGILSETKEIVSYLKERGIPVILDAAHGAHLDYTSLPSGVSTGADFVIESVHKTLSAPTQGALLYLQGKADLRRTQRALNLFQTSSPSYLLLSGIEASIDEAEDKGEGAFSSVFAAHDALAKSLTEDEPVYLYSPEDDYDKSKFVFFVPDAKRLEEELIETERIIPEFASGEVLVMMTGINTSQRDLDRLLGAMKRINERYKNEGLKREPHKENRVKPFTVKKKLWETLLSDEREVLLEKAEGKLSSDFLIPYPPGSALAVPGSVIDKELIERLRALHEDNVEIKGLNEDEDGLKIYIIEE